MPASRLPHPRQPKPNMKPPSQVKKTEQVSKVLKVPAIASAMPSTHGSRPVRLAKQVRLAPGYVDSSTLLFGTDDEGTDYAANSEGEIDSDEQGMSDGDEEDCHIAKKPRLEGNSKASVEEELPPSLPDSSCLSYNPETYAAVQRWNRMLDLPPPDPITGLSINKMPKRESEAPKSPTVQTSLPKGVINKNPFYDETKAGFERLPGEIRSMCLCTYHCKYRHTQRFESYKG